MNLIRYQHPECSPLKQIDSLFQEAFDCFNTSPVFNALFSQRAASEPTTDMYEDVDNYHLRFELPGFEKKDVKLSIENHLLNVSAERKDKENETSVKRSLLIPEAVEADKINASLKNGLLTVTLPKSKKAKGRSITVN